MNINYFKVIWIILLMLCFFDMPYAYYTLVKWFISILCGYIAYLYHEAHRTQIMLVFITFTVLYNPIAPFYLGRGLWLILDVILIVIFLMEILLISKKRETRN